MKTYSGCRVDIARVIWRSLSDDPMREWSVRVPDEYEKAAQSVLDYFAASPSSPTGATDEQIERFVREAWTAGAMDRDTDWKAWWLAHRDSILTAAHGSDSDDA